MIEVRTDEDRRQIALLTTPVGQPGSGRVRYGAAMYFNRAGSLSDAALEVYRTCSPYDAEDPKALLRVRGLGAETPPEMSASANEALIRLAEEAGRYIAMLDGPGVAEVRTGLAHWAKGPPQNRTSPSAHPVVDRWLGPALVPLGATHPALSAAIGMAAGHLCWTAFDGYPAAAIGSGFSQGHAYAPLIGDRGVFPAEDWEFGLFLIAPHVLYRDHHHPAPELYAPLTGPHGWRFGPGRPLGLKPAHSPVWNDPMVAHLTKVGPVPFLCFYCWTGQVSGGARVVPADDWAALEDLRLPG